LYREHARNTKNFETKKRFAIFFSHLVHPTSTSKVPKGQHPTLRVVQRT
jgi:hypothetical protein